jgi:hypothetical protein
MLSQPSAAAATTTKVILFSPWSFSGLRHSLSVTETTRGACWIASLSSGRPDAWRCMAGNEIHDPCFSGSPNADTVACVSGPFSHEVVLMRLTKPLPPPNGESNMARPPWALKLANGATCGFVNGATGTVAGMRLNYSCSNKAWVIGEPERSSGVWRVFYISSPDDSDTQQMGVAEAIF